jgi:aminomethyltransferase
MKPLPLHNQHLASGALFQPWGEWEVPAHYGQPESEYHTARQTVGIGDLSHRGKCLITGEDHKTWLQSVISQDILPYRAGQGGLSTFMNHKGKILSYFRVYVREESLFLEDVGSVGDQTFQALKKFLLYGTKAKLHNCLDNWGILLVTGPKAQEIVQDALSIRLEGLETLHHASFVSNEMEGFVTKSQETPFPDYEVFVPTDRLVDMWEGLLNFVRAAGGSPVGHATLDTLRIEAGYPRLGPDINDQIVPPEANLEGKAFSLSKGCYPGQEVVARMDTYGSVKRRLVGLIINGNKENIPEKGAKIFSGTREIGWVSSTTYSPVLGKPIALGFPLRDFTQPDTPLEIESAGTRIPAIVSSLPFTRSE